LQEELKESKQERLSMVKGELDKIEEALIEEARGEAREDIIEKLQTMRDYKEAEEKKLKKEIKNTKYIDPNIVTALRDLGCDDKMISQYVEAIENGEQLPFELNYELEDIVKSDVNEKGKITKIAKAAEKCGADVSKDRFLKKMLDGFKLRFSKIQERLGTGKEDKAVEFEKEEKEPGFFKKAGNIIKDRAKELWRKNPELDPSVKEVSPKDPTTNDGKGWNVEVKTSTSRNVRDAVKVPEGTVDHDLAKNNIENSSLENNPVKETGKEPGQE